MKIAVFAVIALLANITLAQQPAPDCDKTCALCKVPTAVSEHPSLSEIFDSEPLSQQQKPICKSCYGKFIARDNSCLTTVDPIP
jgi:hypothetical protein